MQSMPLLLRQSLRSSANLSRTSRPVRPQFLPAPRPSLLVSRNTRRKFSICLQCQFRSQPIFYSSNETDKLKEENIAQQSKDASSTTALPEEVPKHEPDTDSQRTDFTVGGNDTVQRPDRDEKNGTNPDGIETGGLPSYLENRRSQFSKQFTTMMDNLQANVFVAGQRLNDLTGYSSIEVLKKDIHAQEERLRNARLRVREAKDAYAAAINRRSASQREINELLQRKHAWSAADLERFTHLYRNDHANEVAETETQEALSVAERQSEETAAQLSKSILSRYHEEQVWSDKIRRMSTWGTWGLMGVNVLLFLIFQIAVEPWRRKRLVKGFEEKVIEALEKDKAVNHTEVLNTGSDLPQEPPVAPQEIPGSSVPVDSEIPSVRNEIATSDTPALDSAATSSSLTATETTTETTTDQLTEDDTDKNTMDSVLETFKFHLSRIPPPPDSVESWRQAVHDMFSDRSIDITQRDLTAVSIQSAAAGAAIMALVIALIQR